jgi:uncharacterized protein
VFRGLLSFGHTSRIRTAKLLDLSADLPILIEIVDEKTRIHAFLPALDDLFRQSGCGGLVTMEKVDVIDYRHTH